MADELADWWVHQVDVETLTGSGAYGDVYDDPVPVACFRDDKRRLVRDRTGAEVVSEGTLYCSLEHAGKFTPGSRVDLGTRVAVVIGEHLRDAPGLDLPEHLEIVLT